MDDLDMRVHHRAMMEAAGLQSIVRQCRTFSVDSIEKQLNLLQQTLTGFTGKRFLHKAKEARRNVFVWTVNKEKAMEWSIRHSVDGVITDDPKLFREVCDRWEEEGREAASQGVPRPRPRWETLRMLKQTVTMDLFALLVTILLWRRFQNLGKSKQGRLMPVTVKL